MTRFVSLIAEVATFLHACEGDAVIKLTHEKIPRFNIPIYLQNKTQIGKVDEIFGPINESVSSLFIYMFCCLLLLLLLLSSVSDQTRGSRHLFLFLFLATVVLCQIDGRYRSHLVHSRRQVLHRPLQAFAPLYIPSSAKVS